MKRIKIFIKNRKESSDSEYVKLNSKCLRSYILNSIILRKEEWNICFKGKYIHSFRKRIKDWIDYYKYSFFIFILNNDYLKISRPCNIKVSNTPREDYLEEILKKAGIEIIDEKILPVDTIYVVRKK